MTQSNQRENIDSLWFAIKFVSILNVEYEYEREKYNNERKWCGIICIFFSISTSHPHM